jgi:hypothetical protein
LGSRLIAAVSDAIEKAGLRNGLLMAMMAFLQKVG